MTLRLMTEKHFCPSRTSPCLLIPDLSSDLDLVYIVLEIAELLAEEYLLSSLGSSHILVRSIATGEALV